jgi:hypothetical protein
MSTIFTSSLFMILTSCTEVAVNPITTPVTGGETETGQTTTMSTNTSSTVTTSTKKTTTTTGKQSVVDCLDILISGKSTGDGVYDIDPLATGAYEVYCVMDATYDGGGWTLAAVSSDDGQDTWTWNNRHYWDTDTTTFGDLGSLNEDFKSPALHEVGMGELLFIHAPSGVWAGYSDVGDSTGSLGLELAAYGEYVEYPTGVGHMMSSGTLSNTGLLCSTDLFLNPCDLEGGDSCNSDQNGTAYGPAWSAFENSGCPLDDPSLAALGGQPLDPDWEAVSSPPIGLTPGHAVGFGNALDLNTGTAGAGENHMWVLVRRSVSQ